MRSHSNENGCGFTQTKQCENIRWNGLCVRINFGHCHGCQSMNAIKLRENGDNQNVKFLSILNFIFFPVRAKEIKNNQTRICYPTIFFSENKKYDFQPLNPWNAFKFIVQVDDSFNVNVSNRRHLAIKLECHKKRHSCRSRSECTSTTLA